MFADDDFIKASRKFVCIRIETYENKESEAMVRKLLNGRFANTSFTIFNPEGTRQLTRAGRSPRWGLGSGQRSSYEEGEGIASIISDMNRIARRYEPKGQGGQADLQDFNTLRQALNVASADQRLLVFVNVASQDRSQVENTLKSVMQDKEIVGKFHLNFIDQKTDKNWSKVIQGAKPNPGILIVQSGQFGLKGKTVAQLGLDANAAKIKSTLLDANKRFAKVERRKDYSTHVRLGRREGIYFENEIPYGEDRDGDGKIDRQKSRGRGR